MTNFENKKFCIVGGTGSFGSAMLRRLLAYGVQEVRILSRDEKKQDDLRREIGNSSVKFYIGDVRDTSSLNAAIKGVDFVFHAAALKQVPSCDFFPLEATKTNILGTSNVLNACKLFDVERVIVLSTDKAVYPINAMGISKALMEKVMIAEARECGSTQVFAGTRYGNVIASRGSVVPLFINQISQGKPLTITNPHMTRFLMSLDEASELVLFAFENAIAGDIFVQKSPAADIETIAKAIIRLLGKEATSKIQVIGTRHGEKQHESLVSQEDMAIVEDLGRYYRIPADTRDLNYQKYHEVGNPKGAMFDSYSSNSNALLTVNEVCDLLKENYEVRQLLIQA